MAYTYTDQSNISEIYLEIFSGRLTNSALSVILQDKLRGFVKQRRIFFKNVHPFTKRLIEVIGRYWLSFVTVGGKSSFPSVPIKISFSSFFLFSQRSNVMQRNCKKTQQ